MKQEKVDKLLQEKLEDGEHISPVLPEGVKNYLIDIDGTICDDIPNEEPERMATAKLYAINNSNFFSLVKRTLVITYSIFKNIYIFFCNFTT